MPPSLSKEIVVALAGLLLLALSLAFDEGAGAPVPVPEVPPAPSAEVRAIESFPNLRQALPKQPVPPPLGTNLAQSLLKPIEIWSPASYPELAIPPLPRGGVIVPGGDLARGLDAGGVRVPREQLLMPAPGTGSEQ